MDFSYKLKPANSVSVTMTVINDARIQVKFLTFTTIVVPSYLFIIFVFKRYYRFFARKSKILIDLNGIKMSHVIVGYYEILR